MTNQNNITKVISKYALILVILYLTEDVFDWSFQLYFRQFVYSSKDLIWAAYIPTFLGFSFNILTAILIFNDVKRFGLKAKYLFFLTIVWRPLGVCLFLISLAINPNKDKNQPTGNTHSYRTAEGNEYLDNDPDLVNI
ncbi:MAG TPA: hypothetical protein VIH57_12230 [Bacteroidales bacterium]